jgi:rubredoxin
MSDETQVWDCLLCGYSYDPAIGSPDHGIAPGTPWNDVPADFLCPECGAGKADFDPDAR